jgi:hypothetical protein
MFEDEDDRLIFEEKFSESVFRLAKFERKWVKFKRYSETSSSPYTCPSLTQPSYPKLTSNQKLN